MIWSQEFKQVQNCLSTIDNNWEKNSQTRKDTSLETMWASEEFQGKRAGGDNQPATFSGFRLNKKVFLLQMEI